MRREQTQNTKPLITKHEMAEMLGIGKRTLDTWMQRGLIPYLRITKRKIRFDPIAVLAHMRRVCAVNPKQGGHE